VATKERRAAMAASLCAVCSGVMVVKLVVPDPSDRALELRTYVCAECGHIHRTFLARIVEEGPIPAIHGVVRWRACDLIMRLHEEFGLSVSDDTIYRALKNLGFSHVSARPKAYKQNAEAMDAFKKTSPSVWRKSARSSHPTHR